ncbi:helix-turn-helix transcriptional regulator [Paenibacillus aquistagni]|uniref:helix-turn-helix transcriptional regulator n=1 Tax=Paenibacillus aquistagni TaxID=1852522 RepID=UPI00145A4AB0|nr:AraC family transcriptional regulator [Paenibacillus aquistagni]NMM54681.1 helix-turn-helix transcriptional regulator [Paenibacillus aquistagni]
MRTRNSESGFKGIMYWRSIVLAILLTCLPISVITAVYLYVGNQHMINQYQQRNEEALVDAARQVDEQFTQLVQYALNMVVKPYFKSSLSDMDFISNIEVTDELFNTLNLVESADPLVDQVYLYIQKQNKIMEPELGLRTLDDKDDASSFGRLMEEDADMFWVHDLERPFNKGGSSHALVMRLPFNGHAPYGAIVIYIDPSKLHVIRNAENISFLLDGKSHLIGESGQSRMMPEAMSAIREQLELKHDGEGLSHQRMRVPIDDDVLLVNTVQFEKMQSIWTYVSGTPQSMITAPTKPYTHIILMCFAFALAGSLGVSWYASKSMYRPIRKMLNLIGSEQTRQSSVYNELDYIEHEWKRYRFSHSTLQSQWQQSLPAIREAYINQFVNGQAAHLTEAEYVAKLNEMELDISDRQFAAIVLQQHTHGEARVPLTENDQHLLTYAALNVIQELAEELDAYVHTINFFDGSFGVILIAPAEQTLDEQGKQMRLLGDQIMRALRDTLRMTATIVLGGPSSQWTDVPHIVEQAKRALQYRFFDAGSQLLEAETVLSQKNDWVDFPLELEQEFIHNLNLGLREEAMRSLSRFVTALQASGSSEWHVHHGLIRLITSVHRSMLQAGLNPYQIYDFSNLQEQLSLLREPKACIHWLEAEIIVPYLHQLTKNFNSSMKSIVEHVLEQIEQNGMQDLSLDTIAAEAGVSVSQLSKAFKQMTGTNYMDYLTTVRMNRCKELLLTTDMRINEIAEAAGYQPSYFNRMFKKLEGVTPGQYRQQGSGTKPFVK